MERQSTISSRVLVVISTVALALCLLLVTSVMAGGTDAVTADYTVRSGDTLWSIADAHAENGDVRSVMDDIRRINELNGSMIRAGQTLAVPVSG